MSVWRRRVGLVLVCGVLGGCADQSADSAGPSAVTGDGRTVRPGASASSVAQAATTQGWRLPPANAVLDYQIGGPYPPADVVGVLVRDRAAAPVSGRFTICYVNAFQTQPKDNPWWQTDHDNLLLKDRGGRYVEDPDWPSERLLDISTPARRAELAAIVGGWFADCAARGFNAVEPDNLDSWTRSRDLLSQADAVAFARLIVQAAHTRGLAVGQKNAPDLSRIGRSDVGFDFALAEECAVYHECHLYQAAYGNQVYEIEYTDNGTEAYRRACADHGADISVILRDRDVVPKGTTGYHNEHC